LVTNVLGDEGFASNLGLDDLQFILTHSIDEDEPLEKPAKPAAKKPSQK
jgi:hypothetical protein